MVVAALTIRNLDERLKQRLRVVAAEHGVSMEEQARRILSDALASAAGREGQLGTAMHELFKDIDGTGLELPERSARAVAADFD